MKSLAGLLAVLVPLIGCGGGSLRFADLWLTPDQQGRLAFERGDYETAAERFEDPAWKGAACYAGRDWDCAIDQFARLDTAEAYFNLGNAYARGESYELAVEAYEQALDRRPGWPEAQENRDLVASLIPKVPEDEEEEGGPQDPTFKPDEVKFDDKADKGKEGEVEQSFLSDEQIAEMWLRGVQTSPTEFLAQRFAFEAEDRRREGGER